MAAVPGFNGVSRNANWVFVVFVVSWFRWMRSTVNKGRAAVHALVEEAHVPRRLPHARDAHAAMPRVLDAASLRVVAVCGRDVLLTQRSRASVSTPWAARKAR